MLAVSFKYTFMLNEHPYCNRIFVKMDIAFVKTFLTMIINIRFPCLCGWCNVFPQMLNLQNGATWQNLLHRVVGRLKKTPGIRCLAQGLAHNGLDRLCNLLPECPGELASQASPSSDPGGLVVGFYWEQ